MNITTFEERMNTIIDLPNGGYEVLVATGINAGEEVSNGFGENLTAPYEAESYNLWESVTGDNIHSDWIFRAGNDK